MPTEDELFSAVDALLQGEPQMPPPEERARLREAAGVTQARVAQVLSTTVQTLKNWENGRSEPRPPRRQAYLRLLEGWAAQYPAPDEAQDPVPETFTAAPTADRTQTSAPAPAAQPTPDQAPPAANSRPATTGQNSTSKAAVQSTSRRPAKKKAAPAASSQFPHGPLGVLDGDGTLYAMGGVLLECEATTIPQLVEWTLRESGLGAPRLHQFANDQDPLIVLTAAAAERFGLPTRLEGPEARRSLRLPEDHKVVHQITRAKWKLTQRGFGPWARIYRPAKGGQRQCVQLAILPWDALDTRAWPNAAELHPADLARVLGVFAHRVITPRGSTAVSGLELMTTLRPPTRPVKNEITGEWEQGHNPGSLGRNPIDPAPPEAPREHPVAQGWPSDRFLDEEAYQWVRDPKLLSDDECMLPWAVGIDINTAFLAAAARLTVGLSEPVYEEAPRFDKKIPGSWHVDLSHIELDPRLPNPFTPSGQRPTGPAWYATPTLEYAEQLGHTVEPIEAFLRYETGAYLDPWHARIKDAYVKTMADAGIPVDKDVDGREFLAAMSLHKALAHGGADDPTSVRARLAADGLCGLPLAYEDNEQELRTAIRRHQQIAIVLSAIKSTVKGGIGKLREKPQGRGYRDGERWPALDRPTWRPDIRAAVIAKARVNMHRKMAKLAELTGLYPLGVLSDCVVYPSPGPSPLDLLPQHGDDGKPVYGTFRLGATPGLCKVEGVQPMATAVDWMEQGYNPARHIKGGDAVLDEGE
ncbi:telomere-associated protein Tap [Streptomyces malaysiensis]|uniref:telomere-associated protein Tap n=1 Tax=Streptomyces malaysiensis TaxID=92644 RepID=UPI0020C5DCF4|nr:helix-turn-helix domain-containing protein [Streptomyces samsunensis]